MGIKSSITLAIGIVTVILLVMLMMFRTYIKVTKPKDSSFMVQQNDGKAANQRSTRAVSSSFGQPLQQTSNSRQLSGTVPQGGRRRRCGLGNLQLGQQPLGIGLLPPLGGGLQPWGIKQSPRSGLQGLGQQPPQGGGVKAKTWSQYR